MPYRDDLDAATARRDALQHELTQIQQRLHDQEPLQARARDLAAELEDATARVEHARSRVKLPLLQAVTVSTPCKEPWAKMQGDDRVRFCGRCEKNVFNLSAMTAAEAEGLLTSNGAMCVRFYRRPDGTVLTSDCPVGAKRRRRRRLVVTAVAVAAGAFGAVWALVDRAPPARAHLSQPEPEPMMGDVAYEPTTPPEPDLVLTQGGMPAPDRLPAQLVTPE